MRFVDGVRNSNVSTKGCTDFPPVLISGSGRGYGSLFEEDNFDAITWQDSDSRTCTWVGPATGGSWSDPTNWEFCQGTTWRPGYPDQMDTASFPAGDIFVAMDGQHAIAQLTGNSAHLTFAGDDSLFLSQKGTSVINGTVTWQGDPSCAFKGRCVVRTAGDVILRDGADLAIGDYREVQTREIRVGATNSSGHLTISATDPAIGASWPHLRDYDWSNQSLRAIQVVASGTVADPSSTITLNGATFSGLSSGNGAIRLQENSQLLGMDNVTFDPGGSGGISRSYIEMEWSDCSTTFVDIQWNNLSFLNPVDSTSGYNVNIGLCTTLPGANVTISGPATPGYGAPFANDPAGLLNWL